MQKPYSPSYKKVLLIFGAILFSAQLIRAQSEYVPFSYQYYQKFNAEVYSVDNSYHTALKPYLVDTSLIGRYNQLQSVGFDSTRHTWVARKLFNEHLFQEKTSEYTFFADFLTDLEAGRETVGKTNTYVNTRGYQIGGTVGNKFYFYTSGYEDQANFPDYYYNDVQKLQFVPGQAYDRDETERKADWSYVTAIISYTPIKQLNITLGQDKTFIGDGYRSLLLSDNAADYPLLRMTANVGKVQYMWMITSMEDQQIPIFDNYGNNRRKWSDFHYLDWSATNRLSLGFFNAIIIAGSNDAGQTHGLDFNNFNPVLFAATLGPRTPYPDEVYEGFTGKYKIFDKTAIYAQLLIQNFSAGSFFSGNSNSNTNGYQVGIRGADLFKVTNFNYLFEYNTVKPYTYAGQQSISSYTDYSQPLGDPFGANFKEGIGILNYTIGRFDFQGEAEYASFGLDPSTAADFGQDVTKPFSAASTTNGITGQGVATHFYYTEGTVDFIINPKLNLRLEIGGLYRYEKNDLSSNKTEMITFGIKSGIRDLYHDF
jgi:hypothetical protein